jgi:hypothetical protein
MSSKVLLVVEKVNVGKMLIAWLSMAFARQTP